MWRPTRWRCSRNSCPRKAIGHRYCACSAWKVLSLLALLVQKSTNPDAWGILQVLRVVDSQLARFTCFTSTKVQILQKFAPPQGNRAQILPSTKLQILTPEALRKGSAVRRVVCSCLMPYALCLMPRRRMPCAWCTDTWGAAPRLCRAAFPHFKPQALFGLRELGVVNFSSKYTCKCRYIYMYFTTEI